MAPTRASTSSSSDYSSIRRLVSLDGVEAFRASVTRFAYARHSHDSYAFGTIDDGAMRFWHGGAEHAAWPGDVFSINPGEVHDGRAGVAGGCRYRMLYVEGPAIEALVAADAPSVRRGFALQGPVLRDPRCARRVRALHASLDGEDIELLEQQSRLLHFLFGMFSAYGRPRVAARNAGDERRCIARAKDYIAGRLGEPVRLTEIAADIGLSPYYFLRTFRRATGMPPHAYQNQLRLERARRLLRAGETPAQVAAELGFADQSHLHRRFKAAFGVTPGQYRAAA